MTSPACACGHDRDWHWTGRGCAGSPECKCTRHTEPPLCVCGHHSHDHASDPSGSGMTDCWHGDSEDSHGYPINKCQCREYAPAGEEITA